MENLAGDLLLGLKFVELPILPTLFTQFIQDRLGELTSGYLGLKGLKHKCSFGCIIQDFSNCCMYTVH